MSKCMPRRTFLASSCQALATLGALPFLPVSSVVHAAETAEAPAREASYYVQLPGGNVQCSVCPMNCILKPGQVCFCRNRKNVDGRMRALAYANPSLIEVDSIEKGPLAHFLPATKTLSIGLSGCTLRCLYCQNWQVSQASPLTTDNIVLLPGDVASLAEAQECKSVAFTYTEPVTFQEYVVDVARAVRPRGLKVTCMTAAHINEEPLKEWFGLVDAFTVSLKGFTEEFYQRVCGQSLEPVLKALSLIAASGSWLEIVNLVVPGYNDQEEDIRKMSRWISANLGPDVPLHFARFVPMYRLKNLPSTPMSTLEKAVAIAREEGLRHVYLSNVGAHDDSNTRCHGCDKVLVRRLGLKVLENRVIDGRCPDCLVTLPGVWSI